MRSVCETAHFRFWVIRVVLASGLPLPVHPDKQTYAGSVDMSQRCHSRTHAVQQKESATRSPRRRARRAFETGLRRICFDLSDGGALASPSAPVTEFSSI
jgi:hypothetical protein